MRRTVCFRRTAAVDSFDVLVLSDTKPPVLVGYFYSYSHGYQFCPHVVHAEASTLLKGTPFEEGCDIYMGGKTQAKAMDTVRRMILNPPKEA